MKTYSTSYYSALMYLTCFVGLWKVKIHTGQGDKLLVPIFYTPQYAAINKGYFKDEGIDIELTTAQGADKVTAAVLSGTVISDLLWT